MAASSHEGSPRRRAERAPRGGRVTRQLSRRRLVEKQLAQAIENHDHTCALTAEDLNSCCEPDDSPSPEESLIPTEEPEFQQEGYVVSTILAPAKLAAGIARTASKAATTVASTAGNTALNVASTAGNKALNSAFYVASTAGNTARTVASTAGNTAFAVASTAGQTALTVASTAGNTAYSVASTTATVAASAATTTVTTTKRTAANALRRDVEAANPKLLDDESEQAFSLKESN